MNFREIDEQLIQRIVDLEEWLKDNGDDCKEKQSHLVDGAERIYWHYGYMMALKDVSRFLKSETAKLN